MDTLIVVDVQNDFCPGGSLEVKRGDEVVPFVNRMRGHYPLVVFTQDWHPKTHKSFASNNPGTTVGQVIQLAGAPQVMWPDHCVQGTPGAAFHATLDRRKDDLVFRKGEVPEIDSYSGFMDNDHRHETGLRQFLMERGVTDVTVVGLATDYCVKFTVLDALGFGLKVQVLKEGCRAVNLQPGDEAQAYTAMQQAGANVQ